MPGGCSLGSCLRGGREWTGSRIITVAGGGEQACGRSVIPSGCRGEVEGKRLATDRMMGFAGEHGDGRSGSIRRCDHAEILAMRRTGGS